MPTWSVLNSSAKFLTTNCRWELAYCTISTGLEVCRIWLCWCRICDFGFTGVSVSFDLLSINLSTVWMNFNFFDEGSSWNTMFFYFSSFSASIVMNFSFSFSFVFWLFSLFFICFSPITLYLSFNFYNYLIYNKIY